jgi:hypothetical protein
MTKLDYLIARGIFRAHDLDGIGAVREYGGEDMAQEFYEVLRRCRISSTQVPVALVPVECQLRSTGAV